MCAAHKLTMLAYQLGVIGEGIDDILPDVDSPLRAIVVRAYERGLRHVEA